MTYDQFFDLYSSLYRFFYATSEPDPNRINELFKLLRHVDIENFKQTCIKIKENEDTLPRNIVAYHHKVVEHKSGLSRGGNFPRKNYCAACEGTGFIGIYAWIDPQTKQIIRSKIREVTDTGGGYEMAKRCSCSIGQKIPAYVQMATDQEIQDSIKLNTGGGIENVHISNNQETSQCHQLPPF